MTPPFSSDWYLASVATMRAANERAFTTCIAIATEYLCYFNLFLCLAFFAVRVVRHFVA